MSRSVPEWVGKSDDAAVPPRVRLRVFERDGGVCYLTGVRIRPGDRWDLEHVVALCNGGEHREANMAPALAEAHKSKTRVDRQVKAKCDRVRKKHLGMKAKRRTIPGRRFNGEPIPPRIVE